MIEKSDAGVNQFVIFKLSEHLNSACMCVYLYILTSSKTLRRDPDDKLILSDGGVTSSASLQMASPKKPNEPLFFFTFFVMWYKKQLLHFGVFLLEPFFEEAFDNT
jgi:hypothetical protein